MYLVVGDIGNNSGEGLDFIDGQTFLERFYSVYGKSYSARSVQATTNCCLRRHDEQALRYRYHGLHDCYDQLIEGWISKK